MKSIPLLKSLSAALLVVSGLFYWMTPKTQITFFDKEAVQGQFIRQLAEMKATKSQIEQSTKRFNEVLNHVLINVAAQKKAVILKKQDVFAGGIDITDEVRTQLSHAMRAKS